LLHLYSMNHLHIQGYKHTCISFDKNTIISVGFDTSRNTFFSYDLKKHETALPDSCMCKSGKKTENINSFIVNFIKRYC
jgi:hypothetical protein